MKGSTQFYFCLPFEFLFFTIKKVGLSCKKISLEFSSLLDFFYQANHKKFDKWVLRLWIFHVRFLLISLINSLGNREYRLIHQSLITRFLWNTWSLMHKFSNDIILQQHPFMHTKSINFKLSAHMMFLCSIKVLSLKHVYAYNVNETANYSKISSFEM